MAKRPVPWLKQCVPLGPWRGCQAMEHGLTPVGGLTQPHEAGQTEPSFRADRYHQKLPSQEQHQFLSPTHSIYSHRHQNHKDPSCLWHIESIYATSPDFSPRFQLLLAPPEYLLPRKDSQGHKRDSPSGDTQKAQCLVRSQPQSQAQAYTSIGNRASSPGAAANT